MTSELKRLRTIDAEHKVIGVYANKGGVGKTTLVREIICGIIQNISIRKVLIIDSDPQGNLSSLAISEFNESLKIKHSWLPKLNKDEAQPYNVVEGEVKIDLFCSFDEDDELTSGFAISMAQNKMTTALTNLVNLMTNLKTIYDLIIVDMSPSLGVMNKCLIVSCDVILGVVMSDEYSRAGLNKIKAYYKNEIYKNLRKLYGKTQESNYIGCILNMTSRLNPTQHDSTYIAEFNNILKPLNSKVITYLPKISASEQKSWNSNCFINRLNDGYILSKFSENIKLITEVIRTGDYSGLETKDDVKVTLGVGSHVYVMEEVPIKEEISYHKIGFTTDGDRIKSLQTGNPRNLIVRINSLSMSVQQSRFIEKYLHRLFSKTRMNREWFRLTLDDLAQIRELIESDVIICKILLKDVDAE